MRVFGNHGLIKCQNRYMEVLKQATHVKFVQPFTKTSWPELNNKPLDEAMRVIQAERPDLNHEVRQLSDVNVCRPSKIVYNTVVYVVEEKDGPIGVCKVVFTPSFTLPPTSPTESAIFRAFIEQMQRIAGQLSAIIEGIGLQLLRSFLPCFTPSTRCHPRRCLRHS
jgi:hypothetical protein